MQRARLAFNAASGRLDAFGRVWIRLDDLGAMNTRTGILDLAIATRSSRSSYKLVRKFIEKAHTGRPYRILLVLYMQ